MTLEDNDAEAFEKFIRNPDGCINWTAVQKWNEMYPNKMQYGALAYNLKYDTLFKVRSELDAAIFFMGIS